MRVVILEFLKIKMLDMMFVSNASCRLSPRIIYKDVVIESYFLSFPSEQKILKMMCRDAGLTREELERAPAASAVRDLRATLHHLLQV